MNQVSRLYMPSLIAIGLSVGVIFGYMIAVNASLAARFGAVFLFLFSIFVAYFTPTAVIKVSFVRSCLLLYAFFAIVWPKYILFRFPGMPAINPEKILFVVLIFSWFWCALKDQETREKLVNLSRFALFPILCIILFIVWRGVTAFVGDLPPLLGLKVVVTELLSYFIFFLIAYSCWDRVDHFKSFVYVVVLSATVVGLIGVYESSLSRNLFAQYVSLENDVTGRLTETLREKFRAGKYRVQSTAEHPLVLAEFMVIAFSCGLFLFAESKRLSHKFLLVMFLVLSTYIVYKTDSRAALTTLVFISAIFICLFSIRRSRANSSIVGMIYGVMVPVAMLLIPIVVVIGQKIVSGDIMQGSASLSARQFMLDKGIPLVLDSPFVGYGVGQGGEKVGYVLDSGLYSIDNYYLTVALDSGLIALILYISILLWLGLHIFKLSLHKTSLGVVAIGVFLTFIGFVTMRSILTIPTNSWLFFSVMGAVPMMMKMACGFNFNPPHKSI